MEKSEQYKNCSCAPHRGPVSLNEACGGCCACLEMQNLHLIDRMRAKIDKLEKENRELVGALRGLFYDVFFKKDNQNTDVVDTIWHDTMTTSFDQFSEYLGLSIDDWSNIDGVGDVLLAKIKKEGEG